MGKHETSPPDLGTPEDIWDRIPESIQAQIQYHVRESALGYHIVVGFHDAAAVLNTTVETVRRAIRKGHLPSFRSQSRDSKGLSICWPLSFLWKYRVWRETPIPYDPKQSPPRPA